MDQPTGTALTQGGVLGNMNLEYIKSAAHPMYQKALALYQISFPPCEQRESASQERILSEDEYSFCLIYDGDAFVGLVLFWETERFIYIEHLCILPEMRNRRYGEKILSLLSEKQKTLILEIDPPIDDISKRRKGFYARCGFMDNPYPHIHPPYHRENNGHSLMILTHPKRISQDEYNVFNRYLQEKVMAHAF